MCYFVYYLYIKMKMEMRENIYKKGVVFYSIEESQSKEEEEEEEESRCSYIYHFP